MDDVTLKGERLRVVVDGTTGALREIAHRPAELSLVAQPEVAARHPFMLVLADGTILRTWHGCTIQPGPAAMEALLQWTLDHGLVLAVRLWLDAASGELCCALSLQNPHRLPLAAVAYPYIAGIGRLGSVPGQDELVHPYATGFLVRDPLDHLPPVTSETAGQQPVVLGLYPEGFSGSAMQFMAYSAAGRGGFYIATEDGVGREKWLNFYRSPDGDLRLAVWHSPTDYATRRDIQPGYTTVLAVLDGGTWYDAAERYKTWALAQPWVAQGPLWSRDDRCRWLLENVGLCTFGITPRHNRAAWLAEIDRIADTPVLHVLGPDWPKVGADYMNHLPGGVADWFPAHFDPDNLAVMRQRHDYVVPFEFDLLFGRGEGRSDGEAGTGALQEIPTPPFSRDAYEFPFLCPASPFTHSLHAARDRTLVAEYGVDGVYYDISVNNVRHTCLSTAHGHEPGDATALTAAYRELLTETGAAMREAAGGAAIPQGTEMINEQMLPVVAFYQARAEASPAAPFEAGPFRPLIKQGVAEKIPLFAYVYHEYGPLRLDGWAKLSREQGDLVYFVLGRVFLQGGLIELNYEFSALEDLGEHRDVAAEHYYRFDERHYAIDPELAAFVGRLARARVGRANRYLAYGTMQRPAPLTVEGERELELSYYLYNCSKTFAEYEDQGTLRVPAVLQAAWRYREESAAWLLLNLALDERAVRLQVDEPAGWRLSAYQDEKLLADLGRTAGRHEIVLNLPSRQPVLIEAVPAASRQERQRVGTV